MNADKLNSWLGVLANIGVLVGIIFLAIEVRHSSNVLEGSDEEPYTDAQYVALSGVTLLLIAHYPHMSADKIVGHSDIAPGRKTDPGPAFDWQRYLESL